MSANRIDLTVEPRTAGKHYSRQARTQRKVPAIIYGAIKNRNILLDEAAVRKYNVRAYENALFTLKSNDPELNDVVALMKAVETHPVSRRPEHVDLFALDLTKSVRVFVEIRCEGKPIGLADGGLLNVVNRQIEIECLPTEIPESITVDVSHLGIGDSVHVSEIQLPQGIKLISSPDLTIAVVNLAEEESLTPTPAAAATEAAPGAAPAAAAAPAAEAKAETKDAKK